jgi:hypothetical protein
VDVEVDVDEGGEAVEDIKAILSNQSISSIKNNSWGAGEDEAEIRNSDLVLCQIKIKVMSTS